MASISNIPQLVDAQQKETIKKEQSNLWLEEHADFVKAYNQIVAQEGLPLSERTTI
jgi:antitoxin CcdA